MSSSFSLRDSVNQRFASPYEAARATLFISVFSSLFVYSASHLYQKGVKKTLFSLALSLAKRVPLAARAIAQEQAKTVDKLEEMILDPEVALETSYLTLPESGMKSDELLVLLEKWSEKEKKRWSQGQASGTVYHGGKELLDIENRAFALFSLSNPLHPDIFPYVRKMEAEVVSMVADLFSPAPIGGGEKKKASDICGTMTSGGTESILMAMKAYRDRARAERGIEEPELIVASTAHAAFDKAAHYFSIKLIKIDVDPRSFKVKLSDVKRALNSNVIAVVGSAPGFPHGVIDDIEGLSALLDERQENIGLHVDACLGSYLLPLLAQQPHKYSDIAPFDFRVKHVTSMSVDPHKYGFTLKGSSVILYRTTELRAWQFFVAPSWMGGIYASPSMPGSRPGGLIASTWATMLSLGKKGYVEAADQIMSAQSLIVRALSGGDIELSAALQLCGVPQSSVVAFRCRTPAALNIYGIGEFMTSQRHWSLNTLQHPPALHLCLTLLHGQSGVAQRFLADLKDAVREVQSDPIKYSAGSAAIYGMAASIPDQSVVDDLARAFINALYSTKKKITS